MMWNWHIRRPKTLLQMSLAVSVHWNQRSRQRCLWCNTSPSHHIRSLSYKILTRESENSNTSWPSTQSTKAPDILGMAWCKENIPERSHPFWNYRDELAVEDWLIFKANKLVIPESQKHKFIKDLHIGHLGEKKTLFRAWECIYWPGITGDTKEYIKVCHICQLMKPCQQKELLIPHDVMSGPWEKVEIDIFQYGSCYYLQMVDYFSNFPLITLLNNQMVALVINTLKTMFSEHGIQACVLTNQGRLFASDEFWDFMNSYRFEVLHSTLRYPQSNGFNESMVKVLK